MSMSGLVFYLFPSPLTGNNYSILLKEVLPQLLENVPLGIRQHMWYQHDGAPAHYHRDSRAYLDQVFPNRWIGRAGPVSWSARSSDLTPLDFYVWGHVKQIIYETPVESHRDLIGRTVARPAKWSELAAVFGVPLQDAASTWRRPY